MAPNVTDSSLSDSWIPLFGGSNLAGWETSGAPPSIRTADGAIAIQGPAARLFYTGAGAEAGFQNFELAAKVHCSPGARGGIYFHTRHAPAGTPLQGYLVLINNHTVDADGSLELCRTGSLYGIRNYFKALAADDEDTDLLIRVTGKRIQVWVNDILVVDYTEEEQPVRNPALRRRVLSEGTFALESSAEAGSIQFKELRVRRLPASLSVPALDRSAVDERYRQLMQLQMSGFPLVDLHTHLKGVTVEEAVHNSLRTGINYGIAPNCGLIYEGLPGVTASTFIRDDAGLERFRQSMQPYPVFLGMQAEGRGWIDLFSQQAISRYDYVFTDCLTFTDEKGRHNRLWIEDEVYVDDPQVFMDTYVQRIESVLANEPIDIFVNPTYLPKVIANDYDRLWTESRMDRVIQAAVGQGIAIEINANFRIPSAAFIKRAKRAGAKFSLGTNNEDANLGRLEYCLDMIQDCELSAENIFLPQRNI